MKILFVADLNSPIARNWISFFLQQGDQVEVICQYPTPKGVMPGVKVHATPLWMSGAYRLSISVKALHGQSSNNSSPAGFMGRFIRNALVKTGLKTFWTGNVYPLNVSRLMGRVQRIAESSQPDIVHGLRLTGEGHSLSRLQGYPVALSLWGYDLAYWAAKYRGHRRLSRLALARADGLHADAHRDIHLAQEMGYPEAGPTLVCPGGGGIRLQEAPVKSLIQEWRRKLELAPDAPVIINPRGVRNYIKNREYFQAIPEVLRHYPRAVFVSPGTEEDSGVARLVERLGIAASVRLLPRLRQADLFALFRLARVMASPSIYDGTPNTLLEGMAHGAFPVAGDLESIREWITPGENGLLFDSTRPREIARAILEALDNQALRERGREINFRLVRQQADYDVCMSRVREFYQEVIARYHAASGRGNKDGR
jgi:hypothetical protein